MTNGKIEPGDKFGEWTVISFARKDAKNSYWNCRCSCGTEKEVRQTILKNGQSTRCRACAAKARCTIHIGDKFGRLTVIDKKSNPTRWICKCECGKITEQQANSLTTGRVVSCGCYHDERIGKQSMKPIEIGEKFGELTVIEERPSDGHGLRYLVRCSCGKEYEINGSRLRNGVKSCGHGAPINPGDKFGEWTVLSKSETRQSYFWCRCSCGVEREVWRSALLRGQSKSCGHNKRRVEIGQKYGRLTPIESIRKDGWTLWRCKCDCGNITEVRGNALLEGTTRSCGCLQRETTSQMMRKPIEIGTKFGELTVIKELGMSDRGLLYLVRCSCGKEYEIASSRLREGRKSCGHSVYNYNIGDKVGELEILQQIKINGKKGYKCKCSCGIERDMYEESLKNGTISCGHINSRGEYKIIQLLQQNKINFIYQWTDDNFLLSSGRKCRFDFAIFKNSEDKIPSFIIEYNGSQHYSFRGTGWNNEENYHITIQRDAEKAALCEQHNIPLEIIPYTEFDNLENVITSLLNKYDISTVEQSTV